MENSNLNEKQNDQLSSQTLIQTEWATIKQLEKMLSNPELTVKEKTGVANVLAFHVNTLNKLLLQTGEKELVNEQTLGDLIKKVEPRIARHFRRDIKEWKRTLSFRKY
jgi:DNA repair ATPase RecN